MIERLRPALSPIATDGPCRGSLANQNRIAGKPLRPRGRNFKRCRYRRGASSAGNQSADEPAEGDANEDLRPIVRDRLRRQADE
jgi:hypothetical protein